MHIHRYVQVLQKFLKKNAPGVSKDEEALKRKIYSGQLPVVNNIACSRDDKLFVLVASSKALMNLWIDMLNSVANGTNDGMAYGNAVLFNGFLEKAGSMKTEDMDEHSKLTNWDYICQEHDMLSRDAITRIANNEKHFMQKLRGWRKRYFVLQSNTLSYYTSAGGEKKGTIYLKGATIRAIHQASIPTSMMSKKRHYCILIQAGKDVSAFDPSLIDEAQQIVNGLSKSTLNKKLRAALKADNSTVAKKALDLAEKMGGELKYFKKKILDEAKNLIRLHNVFDTKQSLRMAIQDMYLNSLKEAVAQATNLQIDPDSVLLNKAGILAERSNIELLILRARNTVSIRSGR